MTDPYIDQVIGGCKLYKRLGEGGGGLVYLGSHPEFGEKVVLKILSRRGQKDEQALLRFEREIEMSVQLDHPCIVQIFQASMDQDNYYLIMEFIDGPDVEVAFAEKGLFSLTHALALILQTAKGLAFAHSKNIIHRDIKPSNVLLNQSLDQAKLCDFGLAKDLSMDSSLTATGMVLGTPNFMSPEQWLGAKDLTPPSDVFSLGATFFFMITGHKPYEGDSAQEIMTNSMFNKPPSPKDYIKNIPSSLCLVMEKMLAREADDRFQNASEVVNALEEIDLSSSGGGFFKRLFGKA